MVGIGYHTDAWNSSNWNFEQCLGWAKDHELKHIECGAIDGAAYIQALGYYPHISLLEDPVLWRRKLDGYGIRFSQIDAAYPLSRLDGLTIGVQYIIHTIRWAAQVGCPCVDTTDDKHKPEGMSDQEGLHILKIAYGEILKVAEAHNIIINCEPHGYFTTNPDFMGEILGFYDSPCLRLNMDTGNTFIAGQDPAAFVERFKNRISHVHIKDVSESLAKAARGELTGIAMSQCAIGDGVNAANIEQCVNLLIKNGYDGVFSLECEGNVLEKSLNWFRGILKKEI
ncbi:MAG: sugar phosphate isomerase/epimerase [Candidatus Omnitrophota bacterium]|jgi:sugar phosphate isomerase/epimerase|nr:MAG: sugar phosphate isomerase/epimerase [Candidatus Omnitrophota bacterium]